MEKEKKITRRSLLDWMGNTLVVSLTSQVLLGCNSMVTDDAGTCFDSNDGKGIIFEPGNGIGESCKWKENTVDPQDLVSILNNWNLTVDGMVNNPVTYSFSDLLTLPRRDQVSDFHCVEGWTVSGVPWNGFHLSSLFSIVDPFPGATHITFYSIGDVYKESISMDDALNPVTMMAYGINGSTIPLKHGFPLRLVVPYKWGYKYAKYVYRIELTDKPIIGFWEKYGYSYDANI